MTDFEANLRAVLSSFYIGTGTAEIGDALSLMGLPGGNGFSRSINKYEQEIHSKIIKVGKDVIDEALKGEIKATFMEKYKDTYDEKTYQKYKKCFEEHNIGYLPTCVMRLGIAVSYDMGWQKRSTGHSYDSISGHAFIVGCRTKKIVGVAVRSKKCAKCQKARKNNYPAPEHRCPLNYEGSSGAMESRVALDFTIELYESYGGKFFIEHMVTDDDSTIRSTLKHKSEHEKGKLPDNVPEPIFLADPSHQVKVMSKPVFSRVTNTKDPTKCKKVDALRLK